LMGGGVGRPSPEKRKVVPAEGKKGKEKKEGSALESRVGDRRGDSKGRGEIFSIPRKVWSSLVGGGDRP